MFEINTIDLTGRDVESGKVLTANIYQLEGIDRELSIGQLVMAICLDRATELEAKIIELMNDMTATTARIEELSALEDNLVNFAGSTGTNTLTPTWANFGYGSASDLPEGVTSTSTYWTTWLHDTFQIDYITDSDGNTISAGTALTRDQVSEYITLVENKLDSLNSLSQEKMIELQSNTNKRDQSYDLISNVLKSFNTVLLGNANNL